MPLGFPGHSGCRGSQLSWVTRGHEFPALCDLSQRGILAGILEPDLYMPMPQEASHSVKQSCASGVRTATNSLSPKIARTP